MRWWRQIQPVRGDVMGLLAVMLLCCVSVHGEEADQDAGVLLHRETRLRFATKEEAATAFRRRDRFTKSLTPFDLQSRLNKSEATVDELLDFSAEQSLEWTDEQKAKLTKVVESLEKRLRPLNLPLPKSVFLVQTTGKVESNAAYCRGNAIILPQRTIDGNRPLESLLAHELFHVLSNQNPKLRYQLYDIIGFRSCPPIELTGELASRKMTNPDAPELDCVIRVDVDGETVPATPLLLAKDDFDPAAGQGFFAYMQFHLLVLEPKGDGYQPRLRDGKPWFTSPQSDFYWNIGTNTGYIIHPEEVLADNFKALVMKTPNLPTPRIPQEMLRILD